jgi:hypothetical protein
VHNRQRARAGRTVCLAELPFRIHKLNGVTLSGVVLSRVMKEVRWPHPENKRCASSIKS